MDWEKKKPHKVDSNEIWDEGLSLIRKIKHYRWVGHSTIDNEKEYKVLTELRKLNTKMNSLLEKDCKNYPYHEK